MSRVLLGAAAILAAGSAFAADYALSSTAGTSSAATSAAAAVEQWISCAPEGGICVVPGPTQVRYGAGDKFAIRDAADKVACGNQVFGDPVWGMSKSCSYRPIDPAAEQWTQCASEGGTCVVPGPTQVRYGAGDKFAYQNATGSIACGNQTFGDPVWGSSKTCSYKPVAPETWIQCASEGQTCAVPGPTQVRYGAGDKFAVKDATGPTACTNQVFGDPAWGTVKTCFYRGATTAAASVELPSIPSNFDVDAWLVPSWGTGAIPASAKPDVVGAFRFICTPGQILADDPIVYPGQPGKSHLHQFFGNTAANAQSTYTSLRTTGESTCNNMLNRSAYWIPAMMNGRGKVVRPDYISIYYKRRPLSDPECMRMAEKGCRDLPRGLRYIFGYDMNTDQGGGFYFNCDGPTATPGHYPDIVAAAKACPAGNRLGVSISAPDCWDGKTLDAPDHRSHMAYPSYGSWGYLKCPSTHPYVVEAFTLSAWYGTDDDLDRSGDWSPTRPTWHLSSDFMAGMAPKRPGTTMHADWFGAWDDTILKTWSANCIDKLLNCSGGDLGNGKQLKMFSGFSWNASPRVVTPGV